MAQRFPCCCSALGTWHWRCSALPSDIRSRCSVAYALLTTPLLILRSLRVCSGFFPPRKVRGRTGACLLFTFLSIPHPGRGGYFSWLPALVWTVPYATNSPPWCVICMVCLTSSLTTSLQSGRTPCAPLTFLTCLARWGNDHSSTGRPSRHRQGPSTVPFAMTRTAPSCIPHALSHHNARAALAHSCGISLPEAPALAQHCWAFKPLDKAKTRKLSWTRRWTYWFSTGQLNLQAVAKDTLLRVLRVS